MCFVSISYNTRTLFIGIPLHLYMKWILLVFFLKLNNIVECGNTSKQKIPLHSNKLEIQKNKQLTVSTNFFRFNAIQEEKYFWNKLLRVLPVLSNVTWCYWSYHSIHQLYIYVHREMRKTCTSLSLTCTGYIRGYPSELFISRCCAPVWLCF